MSMSESYQICSRCVMDTTDKTLQFNAEGVCEFCENYDKFIAPNWKPNAEGIKAITPLIDKIKEEGKNRSHDCLIGLSGGLDSSFAAYTAVKTFGLRPLLFHCDAGWNTDVSTSNIQRVVDGLGLDLVTHVINWEEMKDLQRAFFLSGVPFVDTPQDAGLFSALYEFAAKEKFKYVLTGGNNSTECIRECLDWTYFSTDMTQLNDIHRKFGTRQLKTFPKCDILKYKIYYRFFKGINVIKILDYAPFVKKEAIDKLVSELGWKPYQMKHYESRFTRFFESYWTPKKHGYDKRRAYFSSEILTGQMTRDDAIERLATPELDEETMRKDFRYVASKLDWTEDELQAIFDAPNKSFRDYKNKLGIIQLGAKISRLLGEENRVFR